MSKTTLFDTLSENSILNWLSQNSKNGIYLLIGLVGLLLVIYRLGGSVSSHSEKDYINAAADFSNFISSNDTEDSETQKNLQQLTALMRSHPELHAAYDGAIGQTLLNRGQDAKAKPFIEATLARTKGNDLTFYQDFAKTTLLLVEDHHQEALVQARQLQQSMLADLKEKTSRELAFGDVLFAFNLLRIAMLEQTLGNKKEELNTWQEWKSYAGLGKKIEHGEKVNPIAFRMVIQQLATGSLALPDYIAHREELLK